MTHSTLWSPSASIEHLKQRAAIVGKIRAFFSARQVLEVDTPNLARYSVTDPHMDVISTDNPNAGSSRYYLQSSPEYAMKRLLAAGSGPIYQLCKAFRHAECGSRHNPEFTMLEWYRPGFDYFQLMDEVANLLNLILGPSSYQKISYRDLFQQYLQIDPHHVDIHTLQTLAHKTLDIQMDSEHRDDWLTLLFSEVIEPRLTQHTPTFVYDYPASQAALARIAVDKTNTPVAQRFELYVNGLELANGYYELRDVNEQQQRFSKDQQLRKQQHKITIENDLFLIEAMKQAGLPDCSGVALGVDRLVMLALGCTHINDVLAFPIDRA
ncbi:MAG: EF-P lysine aminoacylase GenX [Spongiibacteraceae bacterium]|nr:EF-P lysine aminoacylase GenX [Spongiibacteraceae bacterium]